MHFELRANLIPLPGSTNGEQEEQGVVKEGFSSFSEVPLPDPRPQDESYSNIDIIEVGSAPKHFGEIQFLEDTKLLCWWELETSLAASHMNVENI